MDAVCFKCGESKKEPLAKCLQCAAKPTRREDKIASIALSIQCLKLENLEKGSQYIKKTNRLPSFHESVLKKAIRLVESYIEVVDENDDSDSLDLSDSFFEFSNDQQQKVELVTVHAIGKPENVDVNYRGSSSNKKTYHTLQWEIGNDISVDQANRHMDSPGIIFIWYRWLGDSWVWKCVPREEFEQLRSLER